MTDEQITDLARELADKLYNDDSSYNSILWWCEEPKERKAKELKHTLRFLSERFCLVEKSKVNEVYSTSKGYMLTYQRLYGLMPPIGDTSYAKEETKVNLLESLFPEIGKEVEG